jgi:hypothetical protein
MKWLKEIPETEIDAIQETLKALSEKLATEPKENWQASMAYEAIDRINDHFIEVAYHLERIANIPKPANFKHWRDKDDQFPV